VSRLGLRSEHTLLFVFFSFNTGETMDHAEKRERRRLAALHAQEHGLTSAAAAYELSVPMIRVACREFDITPLRKDRMAHSTYLIIASLLNKESPADIAKRHKVSVQSIDQIKRQCVAAGIKMPKRVVTYV
jgi:hypothetical protein